MKKFSITVFTQIEADPLFFRFKFPRLLLQSTFWVFIVEIIFSMQLVKNGLNTYEKFKEFGEIELYEIPSFKMVN